MGEVGWDSRQSNCDAWQQFAQGEYVGHARLPHVPEYRLRVDDQFSIYFRRTREVIDQPYQLQVGDRIRVESLTAGDGAGGGGDAASGGTSGDAVNREVVVQPDGTIALPFLGQVRAAGLSIPTLRDLLETKFEKFFKFPAITVTAIAIDTRLEDLLDTVDSRGGILGGLQLQVIVTPAGRIYVPGLGSVYVQGLTLEEVQAELDARFAKKIPGIEVTASLIERAPRFVYVVGEVPSAGRFEMEGPTTLMQAIALAGGWNQGANLRQVVVFRRGDDWRLMATMVDIRGALYSRRPTPADEIWLNDSDIVVVPKSALQIADELIDQIFVRGIYSVVPQNVIWASSLNEASTL
jgi:polysaccharide export outer membrane protein